MNIGIFHQKYLKEIQAIGLIFLILAEMIIFPAPSAFAATYNWTQASWAGGTSGTAATHGSNQSGWTNYAAADSGLTIGTSLYEVAAGVATTSISGIASKAVFDLGSGVMIAVGEYWIYRTVNSGATWTVVKSLNGVTLTDVTCVSSTCYAVGSSGAIQKSTDSGLTWATQTSGVSYAFNNISCSDATHCWVTDSGAGTGYMYTTNGSTWTLGTVITSTTAYDVFFTDNNTGWYGGSGALQKTTDGGANWSNVSAAILAAVGWDTIIWVGGVEFADANTGYASVYLRVTSYDPECPCDVTSYGSFILKTTNGGTSWTNVKSMGSGEIAGDLSLVDATHVSVLSYVSASPDTHKVYYTSNGSTFSEKALVASDLTFRLSCSSTTSCVVAYGSYVNGPGVTSDWWANVNSHTLPYTGAALTRITGGSYFTSISTGWIVGPSGLIKKTTDGGLTWTTQTSGVATGLNAIDCTDSSTCWAVGASGVILKTANGGTTWSAQTSGTTTALYDIDMYSSTAGAAVGANGTFLFAPTSGVIWSSPTPDSAAPFSNITALYGVSCPSTTGGYPICTAVGASGKIISYYYESTEGSGHFFYARTSGVATQLNDVEFVDVNNGMAVGASGVVRRTTNGGITWASSGFLQNITLSTISCSSSSVCYTGDSQGYVYRTGDFGATTWNNFSFLNATPGSIIWSNYSSSDNALIFLGANASISALSPTFNTAQLTLTSSIYDSGDAGNLVSKITWDETVPTGTAVQYQIRTSADNNTWTSYLGPDGTTGTYFSNSGTGCTGSGTIICTLNTGISIGDGASDRYYQYKVYLTAAATVGPTVDNVIVQYVVNVAPNFDTSYSANGVSVAQNATTTTPVGHAVITYKVRDADTTSGSIANRGLVTPSFQYNLNDGVGWQNITSGYLASGDTDPKAVAEISYNTYTATWDAVSQLGTAVSTTTAQIRVTANDLEGANNTVVGTETGVTIDTTPPSATASYNGPAGTISLTSTDLMSQSMRISNNADSSADGANADSGNWIATTSSKAWTLDADRTFYVAVRDQFGNTATSTVVGVASTTAMNIRDISNPAETNPRLFASWGTYTNVAGATFSGYKVYRGTAADTETYLATVSNIAQNYYIDSDVASTTRYYYKVTVSTTQGGESGYSDEINGIPNGQGFGTDLVSPIISNVAISNVKATTADVTWSTDELSDSYADYSISPSTAFGTTVSSPSFMTTHTISLTGLTPSTDYLVRVRSRDVYSNIGSSDNSGAGYAFTTTGGPAISAVAVTEVTDRTATIEWNTDKDASSLVYYSTSSTLSGATQAGTTALVGGAGVAGVWQHSVTLTGLSQQTKYYFKVRSLDASDNIGEDTNSGTYFYFNTTLDTNPPTFSSVGPVLTAADATGISWQTNKKASTQVYYGLSTGVYTLRSDVDTSMTITHIAALLGLAESTPYYYVVASVDANGNAATSTERTFTTNATSVITIIRTSAYCPANVAAALAEEAAGVKDTTAPTLSNIKVEPLSSTAKVTLTSSEPASVFVQYGEDITNGYPSLQGLFDYLTSPVINLTGLKMGTVYHYSIKAKDQAGNLVNTPDATFTTQFLSEPTSAEQVEDEAIFRKKIENIIESALPSLSAPFLSEPKITEVTSSSATIEWDTNIAASSLVAFAPSDAYIKTAVNPYIGELGSAQERVKNHKVELIGLNGGTTYHAQAISQGIVGPFGKSADFTFITKPSVPEISILEVRPDRISISWKTNSLTSSFVEYRNLRTGGLQTKGTDDLTREHVVSLEKLVPNTRYELKVFGRDTNGNLTESASRIVSTVVDVAPPKLINVKINNALVPGRTDRLQTIVSWQTDELADSQVFYGEGAAVGAELSSKTALDTTLTTDHTAIISTLKPGAVYRFRVTSVDQVGNKSESPVQVILTPQQAESIIDVISSNLEQSFGWIKLIQQ